MTETPSRDSGTPRDVEGVSRRSLLKGASAAAAGSVALAAVDGVAAEPVHEDVAVEMSDGVTIRGRLFFPGDGSGGVADGQFPVVATFEPYRNGSDTVGDPGMPRDTEGLVEAGYARAEFEVRGTGRSEGRFRLGDRREELDFGELSYWLYDHPKTTGDVGLYGVSYRGLTQWMAARGVERIDRPEQPLQALFPIVTGVDGYRDVLFNGGLYDTVFASFWLGLVAGSPLTASALAFDDVEGPGEWIDLNQDHVAGAFEGPLSEVIGSHLGGEQAYRDPEGSREHTLPSVVAQDIPAFTIQGWYDIFQPGNTLVYTQLQNLWADRYQFGPMDPDQPVSARYQCAIGPYFHTSDFGDVEFGLARRWFDRFLKGERNGIDETDTPLHLFQVFGDRWVDARTWPMPAFGERFVETYYLEGGRTGTAPHSYNDGALSRSPPEADGTDPLPWRVYNPCNQGTDEEGTFGLAPGTRCTEDNREFEAGTLAYTTPTFDEPRNVAGPVSATVYAATENTNTSWVTALSVVAPDGSSTLVSKGQLLGSFRGLDEERSWYVEGDSGGRPGRRPEAAGAGRGPPADDGAAGDGTLIRPYRGFTEEEDEPVEPGAVERYDITMDPAFARIPADHRLRLAIRTSSSWAMPLAKDLDDVVGTYQVQRTGEHASHLNVPYVAGPLPESDTEWGRCEFNCGPP